MKCSICKGEIEDKYGWDQGNNAAPFNDGRCCDYCNGAVVLPLRLDRLDSEDDHRDPDDLLH